MSLLVPGETCWRVERARRVAVLVDERLTLAGIAAARDTIYIENQYFTSPPVTEALARRLGDPDGPEIVLITTGHSPSWFDQMTMDHARGAMVWRLRAADTYGRFRARHSGKVSDPGQQWQGCQRLRPGVWCPDKRNKNSGGPAMGALLLAMILLQGAAPARPPASDQDLPKWARTPTADEMAKAYPPQASKANLAGSGVIECAVGPGGELKDCVVTGETPPGEGFGSAALSVADRFQLPAKAPSGAGTAGRTVRVPIRWLNPAKTQAPPIVVYDETGRTGHVIFDCRVTATRAYDNCVVVDAKPPGTALFGQAGEAALRQKAPSTAQPGQRLIVVVQVRQN